jgi:hypothetical protein
MFLSLLGNSLQYIGISFVVFFDLNINLFYVFATLGSCFGGFSLFLMSLFSAYAPLDGLWTAMSCGRMADESHGATRTLRINVMEGAVTTGVCLGGLFGLPPSIDV